MKGDIILRVIIGFLVPFLGLYASFLLFSLKDLGLFVVFNSVLYFILAYLFFYIRFEKIKLKQILPLKIIFMLILITVFIYFSYCLLNILSINLG